MVEHQHTIIVHELTIIEAIGKFLAEHAGCFVVTLLSILELSLQKGQFPLPSEESAPEHLIVRYAFNNILTQLQHFVCLLVIVSGNVAFVQV